MLLRKTTMVPGDVTRERPVMDLLRIAGSSIVNIYADGAFQWMLFGMLIAMDAQEVSRRTEDKANQLLTDSFERTSDWFRRIRLYFIPKTRARRSLFPTS